MIECINYYSNLIIALAAIISALFAGTIWCETRKYRQITEQLKNLNKKIFERDKPNLTIQIPETVKAEPTAEKIFKIPVSFVNLSHKSNSILSLNVKQNGRNAVISKDTESKYYQESPLFEPINLGPLSTITIYIIYQSSVSSEMKPFPIVNFEIAYKGIDQLLKEESFSFQVKMDNYKFELEKIIR